MGLWRSSASRLLPTLRKPPPKGRLAIPQPSQAPEIPVAKDLQEPGGFCRAACEKPLPPSWSCWRKARRAASTGCSLGAAGGSGRGASPLGNVESAPSDLYSPHASFVSLISFSQGAQPMHVPEQDQPKPHGSPGAISPAHQETGTQPGGHRGQSTRSFTQQLPFLLFSS